MKLHVAEDLALPIEAVTEKFAFLGRTGSGKSYAAQRFAEEMARVKAQFVVLDPVGIWYGLRLAANGKDPGVEIPVLGGLHGDIPLEPGAGAIIANLVVDRAASMILDVSQFESDADKARFAQAFAERFFFRKKSAPSAVHLFVDEAQEFVPQNPQREEARMLHAFTRLLKLGRNFGIGASLLSQRPQEVNKKALNLAEVLFAFQLTGPQERKTVDGWIAEKGIDEDIAGELPKLEVGRPHVWSPAWLKISRVVSISRRWTFDASATPKVGKAAAARDLSPIDLERLRTDMAATIERAKADDPRELKKKLAEQAKRIAELERKPVAAADSPAADRKALARAAATFNEQIAQIEKDWRAKEREWQKQLRQAKGTVDRVSALLGKAQAIAEPAPMPQPALPPPPAARAPSLNHAAPAGWRISPEPPESSGAESSGKLSHGERRVLQALIQFPGGLRVEQLAVLTGYKRRTRDDYLFRLRAKGLCARNGDVATATDEGRQALPDAQPLPTGQALQAYWLARLPQGERVILDQLIAAYPNAVPKAHLDEATGYARRTRDDYLHRLRAKELIEEDRDGVRARETLF